MDTDRTLEDLSGPAYQEDGEDGTDLQPLAIDTDREAADRETARRFDFVKALRDLAAFIEEHPGVSCPRYVVMNVFVHTREEIAANARATGGWEKVYGDGWFYLRKSFGPDLVLDITTERETVCRKVVTGTRTVPATPEQQVEEYTWVCDEPLLSEAVKA